MAGSWASDLIIFQKAGNYSVAHQHIRSIVYNNNTDNNNNNNVNNNDNNKHIKSLKLLLYYFNN